MVAALSPLTGRDVQEIFALVALQLGQQVPLALKLGSNLFPALLKPLKLGRVLHIDRHRRTLRRLGEG
jgi:hypothetical protein